MPDIAQMTLASQAEGRRFEPGLALQHSRAPSRCYAEGLFVGSDRMLLGAAGVPFGVAEIEETQIRFLFAKRVRIDAEGQSGVRVTKLRSDPANALTRRQRDLRRDTRQPSGTQNRPEARVPHPQGATPAGIMVFRIRGGSYAGSGWRSK